MSGCRDCYARPSTDSGKSLMKIFRFLFAAFFFTSSPVLAVPAPMQPDVYEGGIDVREYFVSEKLDGVRGRWTGEHLETRNGNRIQAPAWFTHGWPKEPLDGELWIARGRFEDISGIARRQQPADADWRQVTFMVFDLPAHPGPFAERLETLRAVIAAADVPWLVGIEQFRVNSTAELDARLQAIIDTGGEGLILHHRDNRYAAGPSSGLLKYKPWQEGEAIVRAHLPGKGKYEGLTGALLVETADGRQFRVGSGLSGADRAAPPAIGSRIIYRHNGLTRNGLPRFPRFIRQVKDKD